MDQVAEVDRIEPVGATEPRPPSRPPAARSTWVPSATVLIAAGWWVLLATRWWGGRQAGAVTGGAIFTAIAVLATRPDRYLPRSALVLSAAVSTGALAVAATAPTGWKGASNAADYVCAAWTLVAVAAAVRRNRAVVGPLLGIVVLGAALEVAEGWLAWWGGEDPTHPMLGTFYWWNPFAAYLIAGTALGFTLWLRGRRGVAALGLTSFALGSIGLVYSTSRASDACFAVALALVVLSAATRGWRGLRRAAIGLVVGASAVWAIGGPPFFPHRGTPFGATAARTAHQSLGQNGVYRTEFWREALRLFSRHPLVGDGYHSLASGSAHRVPHGWAISPLAHSGYLQPLSDGGLVLSIPFLAGCGVIGWFVVSALLDAWRHRDSSAAAFVLPLVLGALLAHSAVDFDWSYPANFVLTAILAGMVAGRRWANRPPAFPGGRVAACAALVGVVALGIAADAARGGDLGLNLPTHSATGAVR